MVSLRCLLRNVPDQLPLFLLFKISLESGVFPDVWKLGFINPNCKSGNNKLVSNYRPVTILSTIPKLFEKLVLDKISTQLNRIIVNNQHGFVKGRSIITNLLNLSHDVNESLKANKQMDIIYFDYSKAFDTVDHSLLVKKLHAWVIRGLLLNWIKSYLENRQLMVRINSSISNPIWAS